VAAAQGVKSRLLVNLALLAALIALGLYAYLRPKPEPSPGIAVSQLKRDQVDRIRLERRGAVPIELARREGGWQMLAPFKSRADRFQIDRLLDISAATSKQKLPAAQLQRYGLAPATVTVTLNDQPFAFGALNEVTNEQYLASGDAVYLVAPYLGYGIPPDATRLLSHRLLGEGETPVAFDFGRWKAAKDDSGKWSITGSPPKTEAPSPDDLNRWADEWTLASGLSVEPHKGARRGDKVTVTLRGGKAVPFLVLSRAPEVVLLRADEDMRYRLGADAGTRLLDPWTAAAKK
jgi:hypothetical protein